MHRKIIHIDMDAFYASVEQPDHPEYQGKPIAVGGLPEGRLGVVTSFPEKVRDVAGKIFTNENSASFPLNIMLMKT